MTTKTLLSADGNSEWIYHAGGNLVLELVGSFGGGTAKLQRADSITQVSVGAAPGVGVSPYDYPPVASNSYTAVNSSATLCGAGWYSVNLSGSTTPSLSVYLSSLVH